MTLRWFGLLVLVLVITGFQVGHRRINDILLQLKDLHHNDYESVRIVDDDIVDDDATALDSNQQNDPYANLFTLFQQDPSNTTAVSSMCLVHIGKTAGSQISCALGFRYAPTCVGAKAKALRKTNSTLSTLTKQYLHVHVNNCNQTDAFLLTLRNPLTRLASWWDYAKPSYNAVGRAKKLWQNCYNSLDELARDGLGADIRLENNGTIRRAVGPMSCHEIAWAVVLGVREFDLHDWYNFQYYESEMVKMAASSFRPRVFALRLEFLEDDWNRLDRMLGGSGDSGEKLFGAKAKFKLNQRPTKNETHWNLTRQAIWNLCHALCPEIQVYKRMLLLSENLNDDDVALSMQDLQSYCPQETLEQRECLDIPVFPRITGTGTKIQHGKAWLRES